MTMRERYQPIIMRLSQRIDEASKEYIMTGAESTKDKYNNLVFEMIEIKQAIKDSEDEAIRADSNE